MKEAAQSPYLARFDSFEVNLRSGELCKNGERIRLPQQSFQILAMLLEHAGEVVTRQEIQNRLWPNDTVVEFENSINAAIKRLRVALGDSAEQPRYVETLARRGYRLKVPVDWIDPLAVQPQAAGPLTAALPVDSPASHLIGKRVSHYRVLEILGGGGMGVVYKAEDIKLGRHVALKFLPDELAHDAAAVERFEREARAASALNHPNICTIYEVEEHEGQPFIVMELLEGRTLRELISAAKRSGLQKDERKECLPLDTLLNIAIQIVDGLEAAHRKGILHRDIKPANIFVCESGTTKILDFGVAKLIHGTVQTTVTCATPLLVPTQESVSLPGTVLGTLTYMSPEQVRGDDLDQRTDLFSLSSVLYEMATGLPPSWGLTANDVRAAILCQTPANPHRLNQCLPAALGRIIRKGLEKNREERYQTASELRADLQQVEVHSESGQLRVRVLPPRLSLALTKAKPRQLFLGVTVCAALLLAGLGLTFYPLKTPHITSVTRLTRGGRIDEWGNIVTDGPRIYYLERAGGHWDLVQTSTQGGESQPVGAGFPGPNAQILDISKDLSQFLVSTFVMRDTEMPLWTVAVQGGAEHRVGDIAAKYAVWSPDGRGVLYWREKDLMIADLEGRNSRKLVTALGKVYDFSLSPDGKVIRFSIENPNTSDGELWEVSSDGTGVHRLFSNWAEPPGVCCGRWTPNGQYYIFLAWKGGRVGVWSFRERRSLNFWRQSVPVNLITGPTVFSRLIPSHDGRKLFALGQNVEGDMMRYDESLRALVSIVGLPRNTPVSYCPTNEWILYQSNADSSLWRSRSDGSEHLQLTRALPWIADQQCSPDGTQIVYMGPGEGPGHGTQIYLLSRDGGEPRPIFQEPSWQLHPHWLPDGKSVAISVGPLEGEHEPRPGIYIVSLVTHQADRLPGSQDMNWGIWSPNGRFVAGVPNNYHQLRLYDVSKNTWTDVVSGTLINGLSWALDSESLYYQDVLEKDQPIYRLSIHDLRHDKVYDFHKELNSGYFRCVLYGVRSDGSLLVYLHRSNADLYAFDVDFP